ncbi:MAG: hypothetical protein AB7F59_10605 [Bdellovibrionales bacterium]
MTLSVFVSLWLSLTSVSQAGEIWFVPEPGAENVELFSQPNEWPMARAKTKRFSLHGCSLDDVPMTHKICKNNGLQRIAASGALSKLQDWGIELDIGVGSVKPEIHCDAKLYAQAHSDYIGRVKRMGGKIKSFTMDWPRGSGKLDCKQTVTETAGHVANYVRTVRQTYSRIYPGEQVEIGLWEGYPTFEPTELIGWLDAMIRTGFKPDYLVVDIDRDHHKRLKRSDAQMRTVLKTLQNACTARGIRFGVALWSNKMQTVQTYRNDVISWMNLVKSGVGTPDIIQLISWEYWVQFQNEGRVRPYNTPERDAFSHTGLLLYGAQVFGL